MAHEELHGQLLGRIMRVGQLLASVELRDSDLNSDKGKNRAGDRQFVIGSEKPATKNRGH
jgi:hypothetical protein